MPSTLTVAELAALRSRLDVFARKLGFDQVGVAGVELPKDEANLERWIAEERHGDMDYMARHGRRRSRPDQLVPGTLRVISVRMRSSAPDARRAQEVLADASKAYVARYALGRDYHKILRGRLKQLALRLEAEIGPFGYRAFVDSAPVMEKPLARNAGLGWIGKHTNLISQELGSWIFLGAIVLDAELEPGEPHPDRCGTCRACIDVCPTDAIVAPFVLDARRCISYLTIENRGPIPVEYRRDIGNRIFGCDDCQDVCPWNRFAKASARAADFAPRSENRAPELVELLGLDEPAFRKRFAGSPVLRAKRRGFVRNVAVALGNSGDRAAVQPLTAALDDGDALVRGHAAWALGELGGAAATAALRERHGHETDVWVRAEIDAALAAL